MTAHPYSVAPDYRRWDRAVAAPSAWEVDPVVGFPWRIAPADAVVTAGSCFAQRIAAQLTIGNFNHFIAEPGHPLGDAEAFQYGVYSARFGSIYTARQLVQLMDRAYGRFRPLDDAWERGGRYFDPFRPVVEPGGFWSVEELRADREKHLAAVRRMFEGLDYFIFTLGLTECWSSAEDGAVYPLCPGVKAGEFDPARHKLINLTVADVVADLTRFKAALLAVNPGARIILTVSPVPIAATAREEHVLAASTLTKAVLRVAAEMMKSEDVAYFPSYEVVAGAFAAGAHYGDDSREITQGGVERVMELFIKHATTGMSEAPGVSSETDAPPTEGGRLADLICEEVILQAACA